MRRTRQHLTFANVCSLVAVFIALGGTAMAAVVVSSNSQVAQNTISGHKPPSGKHANLIAGSVNGQDVADNSIGGADLNEWSLGQVPSALVGGFGRSGNNTGVCNPDSSQYHVCTVVTRTLPARARLLLIAHATAFNNGADFGQGYCELGTTSGSLHDTHTLVQVAHGGLPTEDENVTLVGITDPFPAGQHSFGLNCNQQSGDIAFYQAEISTVAISPD
jgi:hypothetical protein